MPMPFYLMSEQEVYNTLFKLAETKGDSIFAGKLRIKSLEILINISYACGSGQFLCGHLGSFVIEFFERNLSLDHLKTAGIEETNLVINLLSNIMADD
jgi:hypothetical protein